MTNRIMVIGSNSFSGSHFAAFAAAQGNTVMGISRSDQPSNEFLPQHWHYANKPKYIFKKINLNSDGDNLTKTVSDFAPTHVVNFAAQGMVAESWLRPVDWYQTNLIAQVKLHDVLRENKKMEKYVHVSTPEVYGSTDGWLKESYDFSPSTPYAASRASCDLHLITYLNGHNFPVTFTRAANVYGPGQQLYRIIPKCILACISGKKFQLHGGGISVRSFIHIDDVVDATLKISLKGTIGDTYHISTNQMIAIKDLVIEIAQRFGKSLDQVAELGDERLGKDYAYKLSSEKLRREFNWTDTVALNNGIDQTIDWAKKNYPDLLKMSWDYEHQS